jgi:hypothetical protein
MVNEIELFESTDTKVLRMVIENKQLLLIYSNFNLMLK